MTPEGGLFENYWEGRGDRGKGEGEGCVDGERGEGCGRGKREVNGVVWRCRGGFEGDG